MWKLIKNSQANTSDTKSNLQGIKSKHPFVTEATHSAHQSRKQSLKNTKETSAHHSVFRGQKQFSDTNSKCSFNSDSEEFVNKLSRSQSKKRKKFNCDSENKNSDVLYNRNKKDKLKSGDELYEKKNRKYSKKKLFIQEQESKITSTATEETELTNCIIPDAKKIEGSKYRDRYFQYFALSSTEDMMEEMDRPTTSYQKGMSENEYTCVDQNNGCSPGNKKRKTYPAENKIVKSKCQSEVKSNKLSKLKKKTNSCDNFSRSLENELTNYIIPDSKKSEGSKYTDRYFQHFALSSTEDMMEEIDTTSYQKGMSENEYKCVDQNNGCSPGNKKRKTYPAENKIVKSKCQSEVKSNKLSKLKKRTNSRDNFSRSFENELTNYIIPDSKKSEGSKYTDRYFQHFALSSTEDMMEEIDTTSYQKGMSENEYKCVDQNNGCSPGNKKRKTYPAENKIVKSKCQSEVKSNKLSKLKKRTNSRDNFSRSFENELTNYIIPDSKKSEGSKYTDRYFQYFALSSTEDMMEEIDTTSYQKDMSENEYKCVDQNNGCSPGNKKRKTYPAENKIVKSKCQSEVKSNKLSKLKKRTNSCDNFSRPLENELTNYIIPDSKKSEGSKYTDRYFQYFALSSTEDMMEEIDTTSYQKGMSENEYKCVGQNNGCSPGNKKRKTYPAENKIVKSKCQSKAKSYKLSKLNKRMNCDNFSRSLENDSAGQNDFHDTSTYGSCMLISHSADNSSGSENIIPNTPSCPNEFHVLESRNEDSFFKHSAKSYKKCNKLSAKSRNREKREKFTSVESESKTASGDMLDEDGEHSKATEEASTPTISHRIKLLASCSTETSSESSKRKEKKEKKKKVKFNDLYQPNSLGSMEENSEMGIHTQHDQSLRLSHLTLEQIQEKFEKNIQYLRDIFKRNRYCERHEKFNRGGFESLNLRYSALFTVPYTDDQLYHLLFLICSTYCPRGNFQRFYDYFMKVLLPEICIKIYMDEFSVSYDDALTQMESIPEEAVHGFCLSW